MFSYGFLFFSLMCKIRSGATDLSKPVNIRVEVHEGKVEGRYSIDGKAEIPGFTFVVIFAKVMTTSQPEKQTNKQTNKKQTNLFHPLCIFYKKILQSTLPLDSQHHRNPAQLWASYWGNTYHRDWDSLGCWKDQKSHSQWCALPYKTVKKCISFFVYITFI